MNEVARALTDWFNDGTTGIVTRLAVIPRDVGDPLPDVGTIADYTRDVNVAMGRFPSFPGISVHVRALDAVDGESQMVTADGIADVLVRVGRKNNDTEAAVRDTGYILRAVMQSWRAFNHDTRTRNQIQIYGCLDFKAAPDWAPSDDAIVTGAVTGRLRYRDVIPF